MTSFAMATYAGDLPSNPCPADSPNRGFTIPLAEEVESTDPKRGKELRFNHAALRGFLENPIFKDRPMVIVSVSGAMRIGKSFLLNFFLRYLRNKGWENENWIGDRSTTVTDGISWRSGTKPDTVGINVWNEVFEMPGPNGKEVVVVLMDTQGLFDNNTSRENNMKLFTLSTMASSVQILNIKSLIQERDLDNLHLCVEIAKAALQKGCDNIMQLQTLMMLIRDWENEEDFPFGLDGGKDYLNGILETQTNPSNPELNEVRKHLRSSFSNLPCFLLPHPGNAVKKPSKFRGTNGELDEDFLEQVIKLPPSVLHPENLVIKQCGNQPMTARKLLNLLTACDQVFADGQLPRVESLVEAFSRAHYTTVYQDNVRFYQAQMEDLITTQALIDEEQLTAHHEEVKTSCTNCYDQSPKIGPDEMRKEYRNELERQCEEFHKNYAAEVRNNLVEAEIFIKNASDEAENDYKQALVEIIGSESLPDETLQEEHEIKFAQAVSSFENATELYGSKADEYGRQLETKIDKFYNTKKWENSSKRQREQELKNQKDELKLHLLGEKLSNKFEEHVQTIAKKYVEDDVLNTMLSQCEETTLQQYQEESLGVSETLVAEYENSLKEKIERKKTESLERNGENKARLMQELENLSDKLVTKYKKQMLKIIGSESLPDETLQEEHEIKFAQAVSSFENATELYGSKADEYGRQLETKIDKFYNTKKRENSSKRQREQELKNQKDELKLHLLGEKLSNKFEEHVQTIAKKYLEEDVLNTMLSQCEETTLQQYQEESLGVSETLVAEYENSLKEKIERKKTESLERNEENKARLMQELENLSDKLVTKYKKQMLKFISMYQFTTYLVFRSAASWNMILMTSQPASDVFVSHNLTERQSNNRVWNIVKRNLGKNGQFLLKLRLEVGRPSKQQKMKALELWGSKYVRISEDSLMLVKLMKEFLDLSGEINVNVGNLPFWKVSELVIGAIPDESWMRFVRLKLKLTEEEIKNLQSKYAVFTKRQKFQIMEHCLPLILKKMCGKTGGVFATGESEFQRLEVE